MRKRVLDQIKIVLLLTALLVCLSPSVGLAADMLHRITHNGQDALALGTVIATSDALAEFQVETIISGDTIPETIEIEIPDRYLNEPLLAINQDDFVVVSLDRNDEAYSLAYGMYQVSSLEMETLEVLAGPLSRGDLAALQWYINSGGTENDFYFIGTTAYVRNSDGTSTQIFSEVKDTPLPPSTSEKQVVPDNGITAEQNIKNTVTPGLLLSNGELIPATKDSEIHQSTENSIQAQNQNKIFFMTGVVVITLLGVCWKIFDKSKAGYR